MKKKLRKKKLFVSTGYKEPETLVIMSLLLTRYEE